METSSQPTSPPSDDWLAHHFDHLSPVLSDRHLEVLERMRAQCPVTHSDQHGGFWVVTDYENVLHVAQDWETFSSELGFTVPRPENPPKILPMGVDPPVHLEFKRLINPYFSSRVVAEWAGPTRELVNRLIDSFVEQGECDFMQAFAGKFPGLAFFDFALHAPPEDLEKLNEWATLASLPHLPGAQEGLLNMAAWIAGFVERRKNQPHQGDVVDAIMNAEIEGRPITPEEVIGTIHLLILGGLETTAGVLGMSMLRFCSQPEIPALLRAKPELIPGAVEELLRLDGALACIARTTRHGTELGGHHIEEGESVLVYWVSANRDEAEFPDPDQFILDRASNRHLAFGAGPHRCAGSNLARMNLRIAFEELLRRLHDIELQRGAEIHYHLGFNRSPFSVPITFTAGPTEMG